MTLVLLLIMRAGPELRAQSQSRAYAELTVGGNTLVANAPFNGEYYESSHGMVLLAFGTQPNVNRSLVAAIHAGLLTIAGGDDSCRLTPLGGCYKDYPLGSVIALTLGARALTSPLRFFELAGGPALVDGFAIGAAPGILVVGRLGVPPGTYLSPGISIHGIATTLDGTVMFTLGIGLSLRTW